MKTRTFFKSFLSCALAGFVFISSAQAQSTADISDPFEPVNRGIFEFNEVVDKGILEPTARGYRMIVPSPARTGIGNFLSNLKSPTDLMNELLQGDLDGAGNVLLRAIINTMVGAGGLFDVAGAEGITADDEDFGQTLATWGVGHGPYLMVPVLGPSSVRDLAGRSLDVYVDPVRLWLFDTENESWYYAKSLVSVIDTREELLETIDDLRANSIDYYATLRSVYAQRRAALVRDDDPATAAASADFSNY